jgi:molybdopterin adenylyltransferase
MDDMAERTFTAAVVTVSDGVTQGTRADVSGDVAERLLRDAGFEVAERRVVPDERPAIEAVLASLAARAIALVATTGGTGFGPRDVTPEATRAVIDREAPGLAELMRRAGLEKTPMAALSRAVVGSAGRTLIANLPGNPKGVEENLAALLPVVPHALELLAGATGAHPTGHASATGDGDDAGAQTGQGGASPHTATAPRAGGSDPPGSDRPRVEVRAVKVEGSPPCRVGNRITVVPGGEVHGTLGCAEFDEAAVRDASEVYETGAPTTRVYRHEQGSVEVYLEPHRPRPTMAIVAATDVARALRRHAEALGFAPVVVEPRLERVSAADRTGRTTTSLDGLALARDDVVVFTDHDLPGIAQEIAAALRTPVRFVGVMGSRRHVGPYLDDLRAMGFGQEDLGRIRSPVGLDLGGRSPEEIALAIAAGVVADANGRDGGWLDRS